jgi:GcrA cell cycle regulator
MGANPETTWPDTEISHLKTLHAAGLSASDVAARLGTGRTRNAVLGKLFRLGLLNRAPVRQDIEPRERTRPLKPERVTPSLPPLLPAVRPVVARKPKKPAPAVVAPPPKMPPAPSTSITVADLQGYHCRWPIGDPQDLQFTFCGAPREDAGPIENGKPYCAWHAGLARAKPQKTGAMR